MRPFIPMVVLASACAASSPSHGTSTDPMGQEQAATARREAELFEGAGQTAVADEVFAADYQLHFPGTPTLDKQGHIKLLATFHEAFPDLAIKVVHQVVDGDRVANHILMTGTQKGVFNGVPASGKMIAITGTNIMRFSGGKIVELWGYLDAIGMMTQLGAIPPAPGTPPALGKFAPDASVAADEAEEIVRRFIDGFNEKDVDGLAREYGEAYVLDFPGGPRGEGVAGVKQATSEFIAAFPDLQFTVEDLFSSAGYVVWRWNLSGTQEGELGPFKASGKPIAIGGISILKVRDGKIVEDRVRADMVGLLTQIDALPAPQTAVGE